MSKKKQYPARFPRHAAGIRLQGSGSGLSGAWWEKRWADSIACKDIGGRVGRARNYATGGQVVRLDIDGGNVSASVVGLRPGAYDVSLAFRAPEGKSRERIVKKISSSPALVARLLSGDMPLEVEEIFRHEKCDLFPGGKLAEDEYDVTTKCSCPDWANPCKHSFAVLAILGEEIAMRPWRLLELRGIPMKELAG